MLYDHGQGSVTVDKGQLFSKMKSNLAKHREMFLEAQEGYREEVIKQLDSMLRDAREGKKIRVFVELEAPVDHSEDYEINLEMLSWSTKSEIEISREQFRNFVLDKWNWTDQFVGTSTAYKKR
jgi:hypothetical protein